MTFHILPKLAVHALPLIPLWYGKFYLTVAAVFLVLLFYIKSRKLSSQIAHLRAAGAADDSEIVAELKAALNRWRYLTFLSSNDIDNSPL